MTDGEGEYPEFTVGAALIASGDDGGEERGINSEGDDDGCSGEGAAVRGGSLDDLDESVRGTVDRNALEMMARVEGKQWSEV